MPIAKAPKKTTAVKSSKTVSSKKKKFSLSPLQKRFAIIGGIVVIVTGGYFGYMIWNNMTADAGSCVNRTFREGNSSVCVKYAQQIMNGTSGTGADVSIDTIFGAKTKAKVIRYQKAKHLSQDGIIGSGTWRELCKRGESTSRSTTRKDAGCTEEKTTKKEKRVSYVKKQTKNPAYIPGISKPSEQYIISSVPDVSYVSVTYYSYKKS